MTRSVWVNGVETNHIAISDRGLAYGDGLFETLLFVNGKIILEDFHWQRLKKGCRRLSIMVDWREIMLHLEQCLQTLNKTTSIIKVIVTRGSGGRGYNPVGADCWCSIIQCFPLPSYPDMNKNHGVHLYPCETQLGWQPALAGIKHLNRLEQVLARQEWQNPQYAEGLVCDREGAMIECTMSNIFFVANDKLITPDLSLCGVEGTMRQWILQLDTLPCHVSIERVMPEMLKCVDEVFICNSIFGVWPVISYASHQWSPGGVTRVIQEKVESFFYDKTMD